MEGFCFHRLVSIQYSGKLKGILSFVGGFLEDWDDHAEFEARREGEGLPTAQVIG